MIGKTIIKMKQFSLILNLVWLLLIPASRSEAQCSDAGVCAIGYPVAESQTSHSFDLLYRYGNSGKEDKIAYHNIEFKASLKIFNDTGIRLSIPFYRSIGGAAGNVKGVGDLMVFIEQKFANMLGSQFSVLLGMRLATGDDNADPALPQAYQPGLGTNDILLGLTFSGKNFDISAGYQLAGNTFTANNLTPIRRGDDLYLQFAYLFNFGDFGVRADAQLIQRLAETELKNQDGSVTKLEKTDQMQVNLGAELKYRLSETYMLLGGFAFPVLKRETNIDGLTRVFTFFAGGRLNL